MRLLFCLALAVPLGVAAQDFGTFASMDDLTNGGTIEVDFGCATAYDGAFVWYNFPTEDLLAYNPEEPPGERTFVVRSAAELDADAGIDVNRCRAAVLDPVGGDFAVFALANADANVDFLYLVGEKSQVLTDPADSLSDGITGLTILPNNEEIYVARKAFFGAPEDGVYTLNDQTGALDPVVTDPDLSLVDLTFDVATGALYALSDRFGEGDFENKIVEIANPFGTPTLRVFADPAGVFTGTLNLTDIEYAEQGSRRALFVLNNSFDASDGEEIARYTFDGEGTLFASETTILADPDVASDDYAVPGSPNNIAFDPTDQTLFLFSTDRFGGADEVLIVGDLFATASEPAVPTGPTALAAYPNPFTEQLSLLLTLDEPQPVRVAVYDVLGREVAVLWDGLAGTELRIGFETAGLAAGSYVVRLDGSRTTDVVRVSLVR